MTRLHVSASQSDRRPAGTLHRRSPRANRGALMQRSFGNHAIAAAVQDGLAAPFQPLDLPLRLEMERLLGHDFSAVRVHVDSDAASRVRARAFAHGDDIVFARDAWAPHSPAGRHVLAHELTHVAQQRGRLLTMPTRLADANEPAERLAHAAPAADALHRTPDDKVSCAAGAALADGTKIVNPGTAISAAESVAIHWLRTAIDQLSYTHGRIKGGAPVAWPTISDTLGRGLRILGMNPEAAVIWSGTGPGTVAYVLGRLRAILAVIGKGTIQYHCLGTRMRSVGNCTEPGKGHVCDDANAASCTGSNEIALCEPFWEAKNLDARARIVLHEHFHNESGTYGHTGRLHNIMCYERFVQILSNVAELHQRLDFCANP